MLDAKTIRVRQDEIRRALETRGTDLDIEPILAADEERRQLLTDVEALKQERNTVSKTIGARKKAGERTDQEQAAMRELGGRIADLDARVRDITTRLEAMLLTVPNIPHASVPIGPDEASNVRIREWGTPRGFDFEPKAHWDVGRDLGLFDLEKGARMSGAGFPVFRGLGARFERALIQFMLDIHTEEHGYTEVAPPLLCSISATTGTGQLPKLAEEMYFVEKDELYLIPTGEVPVTNLFREEIIEQPLPLRFTTYTPCFRREAGAAGRDTRGLIRLHQFDKVELVKFVEPEHSYEELETLLQDAEDILQRLELPYRVSALATGDLSFAAAKCYDIELWAPGYKGWLEVSSCSNFEDFQARRAGIRYRGADGKVAFVHTLNGSGVALPRLVVAILENYQQADGTVLVPEAVRPYMGGRERLVPAG